MRFEALDSWRGVCALFVALLHFKFATHIYEIPLVRNAYLLVDFFFVLSGFVITHSYYTKISGLKEAVSFAIKRFGRLWPLHVATLSLFVVFQIVALIAQNYGIDLPQPPFTGSYSVSALVTNLLFLQPFLEPGTSWNYPSWSIAVEFWTYLAFAAIVLIVPVRARHLISGMLALLALSVLYFYSPTGIAVGNWLGLFRCMAGFFIGSLVYLLFRRKKRRTIEGTSWEIAAVALVVIFVTFSDKTPPSLLAPIVFALTVYVFASERGALSSLMKRPLPLLLGRLSFSIYMVHAFVHMCLFQGFRALGQLMREPVVRETGQIGLPPGDEVVAFLSPWLMDAVLAFYVLIVVMCAILLHRYIELPGQMPFNRIAARRSATQSDGY
jgi:peptidoglycan/LPS O-acetylase OafA/YrhL